MTGLVGIRWGKCEVGKLELVRVLMWNLCLKYGWVKLRLSPSCAGAGVNQQSDEKKDRHLRLLYPLWRSDSPNLSSPNSFLPSNPFILSGPLSGSHIRSALFCSDICFPEVGGCLGPSSTSAACVSAEVQSYHHKLALGLTERAEQLRP